MTPTSTRMVTLLRRPGTDGPHPETSDLIAGWYMIDVESRERALEIAAYVSSEPGPGGEPLYEWIDVREVMTAPASGV